MSTIPFLRSENRILPPHRLAPAPRDPCDIKSYCRGRGLGRSGFGLKAEATTTQAKLTHLFPRSLLPMLSITSVEIVSLSR